MQKDFRADISEDAKKLILGLLQGVGGSVDDWQVYSTECVSCHVMSFGFTCARLGCQRTRERASPCGKRSNRRG